MRRELDLIVEIDLSGTMLSVRFIGLNALDPDDIKRVTSDINAFIKSYDGMGSASVEDTVTYLERLGYDISYIIL
jgi:hypothetical protein